MKILRTIFPPTVLSQNYSFTSINDHFSSLLKFSQSEHSISVSLLWLAEFFKTNKKLFNNRYKTVIPILKSNYKKLKRTVINNRETSIKDSPIHHFYSDIPQELIKN